MGSRIMHYCIAKLISEQIELDNINEFMLGSISPDVHNYMNVPKDLTHFVDRDDNGKGHINYLRFYEKYKHDMTRPFYLGYLCHLISDHIWSKDTYFKIVEFLSKEERKEKAISSYRDFWRLNGRIIKINNLNLMEHVLPVDLKMDEIHVKALPFLLDWMSKDFSFEEKVAAECLELFNNDNSQIDDYMAKAVKMSVQFIQDNRILS